jgi:hypothetical protein
VADRTLPPLASNYVLFDTDRGDTMVLAAPPVVATAAKAGRPEMWAATKFACQLHELIRTATHRSLRTANIQRAHRHITIRDADAAVWRQKLRALCRTHHLHERSFSAKLHRPVLPSTASLMTRRRLC